MGHRPSTSPAYAPGAPVEEGQDVDRQDVDRQDVDMVSEREDPVLLAVVRLMVAVSVHAADHIGEASLVQLRALTVLSELETANLMQLADRMGVTVSTTSRLVDRLVAADFVDRKPSAQTRREISISLSETGRQVLQRYDELRVRELHDRLDRLPARRRKAAFNGLSELVSAPDPAGEDSSGEA